MNASKVIPIRRISSGDVRNPNNSEIQFRYLRPDNTEWLRFSDWTEVQVWDTALSSVWTPIGTVVPRFVWDMCIDTTNRLVYTAKWLTNTDWFISNKPIWTTAKTPTDAWTSWDMSYNSGYLYICITSWQRVRTIVETIF
jgi:hypothetical protein